MSDTDFGLFDFSDEYDAREDARTLAQQNSELHAEIERMKTEKMDNKCFICGKNPKAGGKNVCAPCREKYPPGPLPVERPDWPDSVDDHPFASLTQADINAYDDPESWNWDGEDGYKGAQSR